jgi:citrate lyase subunit beta/citryl-CoA lyase
MTVPLDFTPLPTPALLFCPADRPDRYAKALAVADVVVLDLEDAVADPNKAAARTALAASQLDPARVIVRINASGTADYADDLEALRRTDYRNVMLAKTETDDQVRALSRWQVVALCETPLGVLNAQQIAAADNTVAMMWGAEDLLAAMGGRTSRRPCGGYRDVALHARSAVLLAAKSRQRQAIDSVYVDFADIEGLTSEAQDAAQTGFDLKACIHPSQVPVVVDAYTPTPAEIDRARQVLHAARDGGVVGVDGQMIDGPLIKQAQAVVAWLDRAPHDMP